MSVLKSNFVKKSYNSPLADDVTRKVLFDEDGNEKVVFEKVDYKQLAKNREGVEVWSLSSLLKAGINPDFNIHTGLNTRLEGVGVISDAAATLEKLVAEDNNLTKTEE